MSCKFANKVDVAHYTVKLMFSADFYEHLGCR